MSDWREIPLGELVSLQRGHDLPTTQRQDGDVPVMGSFGVTGRHSKARANGPGVTVGRSGASIGIVSFVKEDYWPLNTCLFATDFHGNNPRFVYYFLKTLNLARLNSGSAQPSLNRNYISPIRVRVPHRAVQDKIASLLSALDDKIELNRRMNETLEAMARAIFRDWFVDFGPTRAKQEAGSGGAATGKANGARCERYLAPALWALFPDRLDDDGKPEGWGEEPIGELAGIVGGATPSTKNSAFWEGGTHAWATPKDLSKRVGLFLCETDRSITDAGLATISSGLSPAGSVLLSSRAPIGYLAITEQPTAVNQGFIVLRPTEDLPTAFAMFWCQSNLEMIKANANGSTFQEISKRNFRPLKVVAPDRVTMNAFIGVVSPLLDRIRLNSRENRTLAATRDLLLPKLMSGEICVAEAAEEIAGQTSNAAELEARP